MPKDDDKLLDRFFKVLDSTSKCNFDMEKIAL